jgi:hypothetical protein
VDVQGPKSRHFAGCVIEGSIATAARSDVPSEDTFIKLSRARNIGRRHFDVADLAVSKSGRHLMLLQNTFRTLRAAVVGCDADWGGFGIPDFT